MTTSYPSFVTFQLYPTNDSSPKFVGLDNDQNAILTDTPNVLWADVPAAGGYWGSFLMAIDMNNWLPLGWLDVKDPQTSSCSDVVLNKTSNFKPRFSFMVNMNQNNHSFIYEYPQGMNSLLNISSDGKVQYCPNNKNAFKGRIYSSFPYPTPVETIRNMLIEIPKTDPAYALCQGNSSTEQLCFYNSSKDNPNEPVFPSFGSPRQWIGYDKNSIEGVSSAKSPATQTLFLGEPNDAAQNNNTQPSVSLTSACGSQAQNPSTCAKNSDKYCRCGPNNEICGLACAPGLVPYKKGNCVKDKVSNVFVQHWQCIRPQWVGIIDDKGDQRCKLWETPFPPSGSKKFTSQSACYEQWEKCPDGYKREVIQGRSGCFRQPTFDRNIDCGGIGKCSASSGCGKNNGWSPHCHGSALTCKADCIDNWKVPAFGYQCHADRSNPKWVQCQNPKGCDPIGNFNIEKDDFCDSSTPFYDTNSFGIERPFM